MISYRTTPRSGFLSLSAVGAFIRSLPSPGNIRNSPSQPDQTTT